MNYFNYYLEAFQKYADFDGRTRRKEFWWFFLFNIIAMMIVKIVDNSMDGLEVLGKIYFLAVLIPTIAISIRRLHDTNHSGWWILINFIPVVGNIIFLVFLLTDSYPTKNQYGENPKKLKQ